MERLKVNLFYKLGILYLKRQCTINLKRDSELEMLKDFITNTKTIKEQNELRVVQLRNQRLKL